MSHQGNTVRVRPFRFPCPTHDERRGSTRTRRSSDSLAAVWAWLFAVLAALAGPSTSAVAAPQSPTDDVLHLQRRITYGPTATESLVLLAGYPTSLQTFLSAQLGPAQPESSALQLLLADIQPNVSQGEVWSIDRLGRDYVARALYSRNQLREWMAYFLFSHFNVGYGKVNNDLEEIITFFSLPNSASEDATLLIRDNLEFLRQNAFGNFGTLLTHIVKSPATIVYLDNHRNNAALGVNENLAREALELYSLGLNPDGSPNGFNQSTDVNGFAHVLSGHILNLSPAQPHWVPFFSGLFHDLAPYQGATLFASSVGGGYTIGATESGPAVLDNVLAHIAMMEETARFISRKLYRAFVSDVATPPSTLIDAMVADWMASNGNLGVVLDRLLHDLDFWSTSHRMGKVKTPLEGLVSTVRAFDGQASNENQLTNLMAELSQSGQTLFTHPSPDGFPFASEEHATTWKDLRRVKFNRSLNEGVASQYAGTIYYDWFGLLNQMQVSPSNTVGVAQSFLLLQYGTTLTNTDQQLALSFLSTKVDGVTPDVGLDRLIQTGAIAAWNDRVSQYAAFAASFAQSYLK